MKFWESQIIKSLGWKEEPKGIAKVISVCMLIVITTTILFPTDIFDSKIVSIITWGSIIIIFVLLAYVILKRLLSN